MSRVDAFDRLFIGASPELQAVLRTARIVAATDVSVLLQGESGTGKELLAEAIHRESRRSAAKLIAINCAALPADLAESELFGHRKGAFTGAVDDKQGRIAAADGGTVFLDEVGELPPAMQAKLLRFLDSGECQAVGHVAPIRVNVRVIAATNRDLGGFVKEGRFREDLFYRLHVVPLTLPPLRRRSGDLMALLKGFTDGFARNHGMEAPCYDNRALDALKRYRWPGNIRELRNFCERMVILHGGNRVGAHDLPPEIPDAGAAPKTGEMDRILAEGGLNLHTLEEAAIRLALETSGGNRSEAARLLGLTRDTLLYRIKKHAKQT